jgi:branched-chain amino acid transport system substrate-binding protein
MKRVLLAIAVLGAALTVALPGAFARTEATQAVPGISRSTITIGGSFPLSGPVSSYSPIARGMETYFRFISARKGPDGKPGIYGRKINFKVYDDAYNPAQAIQQTNKLVLEDKVFAVVGSLGTEVNLAIRPMLNQRKIPHVLVSTGASYWGTQYKKFPWTTGWQTDYIAEGRMYARWILANAARQKIAIFYQNDDYGKDYLRGIKQGLGSRANLIVSELSYEVTDTSYGSQIARQKASAADTWILVTTAGTPTVRALATAKALNWKPDQIVINSVAATDGVMAAAARSVGQDFLNGSVSTGYLKNNSNPKYKNDAAIRSYRRIMAKYGPEGGIDIRNTFYYYGVAKAHDFVKLMYAAGKNPTRASLIAATARMNWVNPYALPGVRVKTSKTDRFPIDQGKVVRYNNGSWSEISALYKGR